MQHSNGSGREKIRLLTPDWPAKSHIQAGTSLRSGGVSTIEGYRSLNIADHVGDCPEKVARNRKRLYQQLRWEKAPFWPHQQFTKRSQNLDQLQQSPSTDCSQQPAHPPPCDAVYTTLALTPCVVYTADCLPILICNQQGNEVAAIHAGWRSLACGIIENTCRALISEPKELYIWLGPAISQTCYEVGSEVYETFIQQDSRYTKAFSQHPKQPNVHYANLYQLARLQLHALGIDKQQIFGGQWCTFKQSSDFFSYRRDGKSSGRMASFICIRP